MTTLEDCIRVHEEDLNNYNEELLKQKMERELNISGFTKAALAKIKLTPTRIQGQSAFFDYEGGEIEFIVSEWKYGEAGICRNLHKCPKCETPLLSDQYNLNITNIGALMVSPTPRWHDCPNWMKPGENSSMKAELSPREAFMNALDAYIASMVYQGQV